MTPSLRLRQSAVGTTVHFDPNTAGATVYPGLLSGSVIPFRCLGDRLEVRDISSTHKSGCYLS